MAARRVSDEGAQVAQWDAPINEVIAWTSQDGAQIEGVLHKPNDFKAGQRYPLLVVIHGGPTGVSRPIPFGSASAYPIDLFVARGALVLEPNYRGSAGYGEKFRALNVRNLGVGDAWDVISGVDALVAQGIVDKDRVGAMGWSQGGYISAFLSTHHSARFRALSVGAGISNWMTYYVNTDIHPFTRQYLRATPWDDPAIYAKTSPMTYIKQAKTPTLIQHGELDQRVPIPNAYELYQGLQDVGVTTRLVVFKGFGHGLNKPKANRAAMEQNLDWFGQYVLTTARPSTAQ
jgi:dipeptidyl aminopeptidase/acylaminoacyl peptidase